MEFDEDPALIQQDTLLKNYEKQSITECPSELCIQKYNEPIYTYISILHISFCVIPGN